MEPAALFDKARSAGLAAGAICQPTPMTVCSASGAPLDYVADGLCGFAWVVFPGRGKFAKWMRDNKFASPRYGEPGYCYWVGDHNQSVARKEAHAQAFADVLQDAGIKAYAMSRLD